LPARDQENLPVHAPLSQLLAALTSRFSQAGLASARREAEWLAAEVLQIRRSELFLNPQRILTTAQQLRLENFSQRRLQREPLQYILGHCEFYGREFQVTPAVLIPRPETELLVEKVIALARNLPAPCLIDLGTGSGCIAVTLAAELPQAQITATDISAAALEVARENARRLRVLSRIEFVQADMCAPGLSSHVTPFDVVVSNPPYVLHSERAELQAEVRDFEPEQALFVEDDGLKFYRCILKFCEAHLKPGGWAVCEMASPRSAGIEQLFRGAAIFDAVSIMPDYAGLPRHLLARRFPPEQESE